jgi:FdrA protein
MATPANRELLEQGGLRPDSAQAAGPDDLLIVVKAETGDAAAGALAQVDSLLARRRMGSDQDFRPRSLQAALKMMPEARWVLVSTPGRYAAGVARDALQQGRNVFLYSDNVALADEVALKQLAADTGLLVMGPDCGTAILNGVGLGFSNRVRRGAIGLVGASGTGLQAVTSRIHALGAGVSHALGTGGRDLSAEVGAVTARQALDLLVRDEATQVIVLVSKPPAPEIAADLLASARRCGKPVVVDFIGYPPPGRRLGNLHFATNLSEAAELGIRLVESGGRSLEIDVENIQTPTSTFHLRGVFSGGTLAYEAMLGLQAVLNPIYSNTTLSEAQRLPDPLHSQGHTILDMGADEFTVGRLHPMMDNDLRLRRLRQEAADPQVGMILLDVVLGEGAHPDPASELAPAIAEIGSRRTEVVVVVVGTDADPQGLSSQVERLAAAGARVYGALPEALEYITGRLGRAVTPIDPPVPLEALQQSPLAAINVGLDSFHDNLIAQGARAVHVDWKPPAGGDERLSAILAKMRR